MMPLTETQCKQAINAMDIGDQLAESVEKELALLKELDTKTLMSKATKMLMTGNLSVEAFGISPQLFGHIEQLTTINNMARKKYREQLAAQLQALEGVSNGE
ncbi:hypothetical protein HGP28_10665 [Vibrio sp. SM6]|uniref:Uncharacterized protein n=1 Tax=Vibrio agarilyticus TaxID=2726741 RepID=A0A7X8TRD5_9VIBR|nr:hypothetical protein [Vibrio agarilyticus]NLS13354.1 hypothetical protein [Vibrio agarilyticus]